MSLIELMCVFFVEEGIISKSLAFKLLVGKFILVVLFIKRSKYSVVPSFLRVSEGFKIRDEL